MNRSNSFKAARLVGANGMFSMDTRSIAGGDRGQPRLALCRYALTTLNCALAIFMLTLRDIAQVRQTSGMSAVHFFTAFLYSF